MLNKDQFQDTAKDIPALSRIYTEAKQKNFHNFPDLASDIFLVVSGQDVLQSDLAENVWINRFTSEIINSCHFQELRDKIGESPVLAAIATTRLANTIHNCLHSGGIESSPKEIREMLEFAKEEQLDDSIESLERELEESEKLWRSLPDTFNAELIARLAMQNVIGAIDGTLAATMGSSDLPGFPNSKRLAVEVNSLMCFSDKKVAQIMRYLGRLEAACGGRKIKTNNKQTSGIAFGNNVAKLLPSQWLKPDEQFDIEFAEGKLSQYYKGTTSTKAGDIIVLLDESGSMQLTLQGSYTSSDDDISREVMGKAILLLLWRVAKAQKRGLYIITFDTDVREQIDWERASSQQVGELLSGKSNGAGTHFENPLDAALQIVLGKKSGMGRYRKADLVMITDADEGTGSLVSRSYIQKFKNIKQKTQLQMHGILVGKATAEDTLKRVADKVIKIPDVSNEGDVANVLLDI